MTTLPDLDRPRIKPLPPLLINQLAAGEIVTRPASVVKELMENAIDAGATRIVIKVTQGGTGLIEVVDNGSGIHPDDMIMAVTRYATSKIADVANLHGIRTLGFRGEALASTASVSRLTLVSCHDSSGIGRKLTVAGVLDDTPALTPIVHPQGTTVTVKDLYFNVPARRGNLKSIATEFAHIETVVQELALAVSHVAIELWHNDKKRFDFGVIAPQTQDNYNLGTSSTNARHVEQVLQRLGGQFKFGQFNSHEFKTLSYNGSDVDNALAKDTFKEDSENNDCMLSLTVDLSGLIGQDNQFMTDSNAGNDFNEGGLSVNKNVSTNVNINANINTNTTANIQGTIFIVPKLDGYHTVTKPRWQNDVPKLIYINGRLVKEPLIAQNLRNLLSLVNTPENNDEKTRSFGDNKNHIVVNIDNLGYVLFFNLPTTWLNINVHPSKQRIGIGHLSNILAHFNVTLRSRLRAWQRDFKLPDSPNFPNFPNSMASNLAYDSKSFNNNAFNSENDNKQSLEIRHKHNSQSIYNEVVANEPTPQPDYSSNNDDLLTHHSYSNQDNNRKADRQVNEAVNPYVLNSQHSQQHSQQPKNSDVAVNNHELDIIAPRIVMVLTQRQRQQYGIENDTTDYGLMQDEKGVCVVSLDELKQFIYQYGQDTRSNVDKWIKINNNLANLFINSDLAPQVQQGWQGFIDKHSVVKLSHAQLLPLLFQS